MLRTLIIRYKNHRLRKWRERIWNSPRHKVIETDQALFIDCKEIGNVVKNSVKTEPFGEFTIVTFSFVAKDFRKSTEQLV